MRDAAVALFVGAVLVVLAIVLNSPSDNDPSDSGSTPAQDAPAEP